MFQTPNRWRVRAPVFVKAVVLAATLAPAVAQAGLIVNPTFSASVTAAQQADIQSAIGTVDALYGNNVTIGVYFTVAPQTPAGQTNTGFGGLSYGQYRAALTADSAANPANTILSGALPYLPLGTAAPRTANDASGRTPIAITSALGQAIAATITPAQAAAFGLTAGNIGGCFDAAGNVVSSCGGSSNGAAVNDAVISLASYLGYTGLHQAQTINIIEHEINEVLGGGGAGSTLNQVAYCQYYYHTSSCSADPLASYMSPTDLYRYAAAGTNCSLVTPTGSFTTSASATACYSLNGGQSALVQFNQSGAGDYGDFAGGGTNIQAYTTYGNNSFAYTSSSPEYAMLTSIGLDPAGQAGPGRLSRTVTPGTTTSGPSGTKDVPEPGSLILLGTAAAAAFGASRRKPRR